VRCIELAATHPPVPGDRVRILNQMTETHRVRDLARIVSRITGAEVRHVDNPRNEAAENELHVENRKLLSLGLQATTLAEGLLQEVTDIAKRYADRCDLSKIPARAQWRTTDAPTPTVPATPPRPAPSPAPAPPIRVA
jgi:UDP-sulfoquinovose synthase